MMWPKFQIWANASELFHRQTDSYFICVAEKNEKLTPKSYQQRCNQRPYAYRNKSKAYFRWYELRMHLLFSVSRTYITFSRIQINRYIPIRSGHIFHEPAPMRFVHYVGSNTFRVLLYKFTFVVYIPRGVIILTFRCCQRSNTYKCLAFFCLFFWRMRKTNVTNFT